MAAADVGRYPAEMPHVHEKSRHKLDPAVTSKETTDANRTTKSPMRPVKISLLIVITCATLVITSCSKLDDNQKAVTNPTPIVQIIKRDKIENLTEAKIDTLFLKVEEYAASHAEEIGGAFISPSEPATIRVWTAAKAVWAGPEFKSFRETLDPEGSVILFYDTGKSLAELGAVEKVVEQRVQKYDSSRIKDVSIDQRYNKVVVTLSFAKESPSLYEDPLVQEINSWSPGIAFKGLPREGGLEAQ